MSTPIRVRRHPNGDVAVCVTGDHWTIINGTATSAATGDLCVTGNGWEELLVTEPIWEPEVFAARPAQDPPDGYQPGCSNRYCPCWRPGAVCTEFMGLTSDRYCPRCGWAHDRHPTRIEMDR